MSKPELKRNLKHGSYRHKHRRYGQGWTYLVMQIQAARARRSRRPRMYDTVAEAMQALMRKAGRREQ